jgi:RND family efflux transporter MFP subunit
LQAQRAEAQAKLDELLAGPRVEAIRAQKSRVAELAAQASRLESQQKRRARLREQRVISEEEFEETIFDLQATQARWQAAEHLLTELQAGTRAEQIDAQRAVVKQLDAGMAQVEIELRDSTLTAPFTGWVTQRLVDEGVIVSAGQSVLQLVEAEPWEVWLGIPPELSSQVSPGMACDVYIGENVYPACVRRLLAQLDSNTRTRTVILTLAEDTDQRVVPGQLARVQIAQRVDATGYWIPLSSLTRGTGGLWALLVANPIEDSRHKIERQLVEVLHTDEDQAFVRGAIEPTDFVVSRGTHRLALDQIVAVRDTVRDTTPQ